MACTCFLMCAAFAVGRSGGVRGKRNLPFGISVFSFFFLFGLWRSARAWNRVGADWPEEERVYKAILADVPRRSARAVTCDAWVCDASLRGMEGARKVSLTFLRDSTSGNLSVGCRLIFRAAVRPVTKRGNPEEFDYAVYQQVRGISGRAFLPSDSWHLYVVPEEGGERLPILLRMRIGALILRDRLLSLYRKAGLEGKEYALFSAVTLGDKSGLSRETKNLYAETGVSHVLALSGMHLGFLMVVFNAVFVRCARRKVLQTFVGVSALFLMWVYVFVAGLPASLVRAASMFTLMWTSVLLRRRGLSVNALLVSAFVMLCVRPMFLYDVGFQLSFLAMAGILIVYPRAEKWPCMRWPVAGWLFRSLWLSFSAQLFTLPLVAFCFGTVSPYAAWATLLVSPLTALQLSFMPLLLTSGWGLPAFSSLLSSVVGWVIQLQEGFLRGLSVLPLALFRVDFPLLLLALSYMLLVIILLRDYFSYVSWLKTLLTFSLLWAVSWLVCRHAGKIAPCAVFYNNPLCPAVHVIESPRCSYLFPAHRDSVEERMAYIASTFWRKRLSESPVVVTEDYRDRRLSAVSGWIRTRSGMSFLILHDDTWTGMSAKVRAEVDYVYVCHGYRGDLHHLSRMFSPRLVVLDASLRTHERLRHLRACSALGWPYYDMEKQGALKVPLSQVTLPDQKRINSSYADYQLYFLKYTEAATGENYYMAGLKSAQLKRDIKVKLDAEGNVLAEYGKR